MILLLESISYDHFWYYLQLDCLETDSENGMLHADFLRNVLGRDTCQEEKKVLLTEVEPYPWEVTSELYQFLQSALELKWPSWFCPKIKQEGQAYNRSLQKSSIGCKYPLGRRWNLGWDSSLLLRPVPSKESSCEPSVAIIPRSWGWVHQPWGGNAGRALQDTLYIYYLSYNHRKPRVSILIIVPASREGLEAQRN